MRRTLFALILLTCRPPPHSQTPRPTPTIPANPAEQHSRFTVEIRAEAFNLLNKVNYNQVARIINAPGFGAVDSELPMRELQFGAKIVF